MTHNYTSSDCIAMSAAMERAITFAKTGIQPPGYSARDSALLLAILVPDSSDRIRKERDRAKRAVRGAAKRWNNEVREHDGIYDVATI